VDPRDAGQLLRESRRLIGRGSDLDRRERALADSGALEREQAGARVTALREHVRIAVRAAEVERRRRDEECAEDGDGGTGRDETAPDDELRPARPRAAGAVVGA
jgi:hypothetical protein